MEAYVLRSLVFVLEADGTSILIDPFNAEVGYPLPPLLRRRWSCRTSTRTTTMSGRHRDTESDPGLREGGKEWAEVRERVGPWRSRRCTSTMTTPAVLSAAKMRCSSLTWKLTDCPRGRPCPYAVPDQVKGLTMPTC